MQQYSLPLEIKLATSDPKIAESNGHPPETKFETHTFIVLERDGNDFVCFEKVGNRLPWRLAPLSEIYSMYDRDYKRGNGGRTKLFWTICTLEAVS